MKKRIFSLIFALICLSTTVFAESFPIPKQEFKTIEGSENDDLVEKGWVLNHFTSYETTKLVYDTTTKIVYSYNCTAIMGGGFCNYSISHSYTPYYSANGKLCKYDEVNKKLVEIN